MNKNQNIKIRKNLLKGIIIGVSVVVFPLLLSGSYFKEKIKEQNYLESFEGHTSENEVGTYQITTTYRENGNWVFETIINTKTGEIILRERKRGFTDYVD